MKPQDLMDYLIPLVFIIVWFLSNFFGRKREKKEFIKEKKENGGGEVTIDPYEGLFDPLEEEVQRVQEELKSKKMEQAAEATREAQAMPSVMPVASVVPSPISPEPEPKAVKEGTWGWEKHALQEAKMKAFWGKQKLGIDSSTRVAGQSAFSQEVRGALQEAHSVRKAFITYEILGPPVGLRSGEQMGRSWEI